MNERTIRITWPGITNGNVTNTIGNNNRANKFLTALTLIGFMLAIYFIYMEIKKRRESSTN